MRIENIIDDIIQDTADIRNSVEEQIVKQKPGLSFELLLPQHDRLSAIRTIQLNVIESSQVNVFRAEIHTQNGYRVFVDKRRQNSRQAKSCLSVTHPMQEWFISILRETIRRRKLRLQVFQKVQAHVLPL